MSRLTAAADLAWRLAAAEAGSSGHALIERAHLLVGILSLEKVTTDSGHTLKIDPVDLASVRAERASLSELLGGLALDAADLRRAARRALPSGPGAPKGPISRSDDCKAAFARAAALGREAPVSSLLLLAALAEAPDAVLKGLLAERRVDVAALVKRARAYGGVSAAEVLVPPPGPAQAPAAAAPEGMAPPEEEEGATPMLDRYSRDLTALARKGELGPVIGRRPELLQVLQTLARSSKNNPVLVGEPGVGKTAIVEALAIRGAEGKDAAVLGGRRIVELNLGALMGGTEYRGELEKRLTRILDEARAQPELILFIDELHTVVGAGRTSGGGPDVANLLKPALARGELCVIGATTIAEYRQHVEKDAALERRFEKVDIPEPRPDETLEILRGLRERWEKHHGVRIDDGALEAAVPLAIRFDPDHRLPDKAVDLVDKAAARARVPMLSMFAPGYGSLPDQAATAAPPVTAEIVAQVLAEKRGLPLALVTREATGSGAARLLELEPFLKERLVGQDQAVERVASRLRLAHGGLGERRGPLAVFLFLGPTGVGKTELARLLAEFLFGDKEALARFDMSELSEEHAVARLLGAPPGYVGHDEEGQLTRHLRTRPYSVVLLDEAEKAHPRVYDVFLQVFDAGRITDAHGTTADARNAIFVLTSNLGGQAPREPMGFALGVDAQAQQVAEAAAREEARRFFRPELLNRLDEVLVFRALDADDTRRIARPMLEGLCREVRDRHGVSLRVEPEAEAFVARAGFDPARGARELRRTIERLVEAPLTQLALSGKLARSRAWRVTYEEGGVYLLPDER